MSVWFLNMRKKIFDGILSPFVLKQIKFKMAG